ncbi:hypothetical protein EZV62_010922 [Acer yangbiense]|uniref:RNase H type-1 domain-containing protein n=1 Tax=Acer yangbiense TaxID=1000413 RepID=A0A5C7I4K1_9ROSI|nr:hypothetical protein EZV62_010922 [Acer yangbiense]
MNSDDLTMLCSALSIKEKERQVETLDSNLKENGECLLSLYLVGVELEALDGNVFAAYFKNTDDRKFIQAGGPWTFDRSIIAFEEPTGTREIEHMNFNRVDFWVQIHNLPLLCMTEDIGTFLGNMIGKVSDVDLLAAKNVGGRFIRARVTISTDEPLMRSLRVDLLGTGEITIMCSGLGHPFRDCPEPGVVNEVTTEAMLKLNVWLRSEIPPKCFNHRNDSLGRRMWGYQGGKNHGNTGQGNWRPRGDWRRTDQGGPENPVGARREKAASEASSAGSELILDRAKGQQPSTEASIYRGKDHHAENLMEVDNSAKTTVSGPASRPSSPNRVLQPNYEIQPTELQLVSMVLGPSNDHDPTLSKEVNRPIESPKIQGSTSFNTMPFNVGPKLLRTQKTCKWKRAARAKVGNNVISDLGKFSQLGKRILAEGEEEGKLAGRDYKAVTASDVVQSSEMQPGSVTSAEVLSLVDELDVKCQRCHTEDVSTFHALWTCKKLTRVRHEWAELHPISSGSFLNFMDFIYEHFRKLSSDVLGLLCIIVWRSWGRNDAISSSPVDNVPLPTFWSPHPLDSFKINCSAISDIRNRRTGFGIVFRNHEGSVLFSTSLFLDSALHFAPANLLAILRGLKFGNMCGLLPLSVESDVAIAVNMINNDSHLTSSSGNIIRDIIRLMNVNGISSILLGNKGSNRVASDLAKRALQCRKDHAWKFGHPISVPNGICNDQQN